MQNETTDKKHILVIGGGVAGTEASVKLSELGYNVTIVEQTERLGGKLNQWDRLFPDQRPAAEILMQLQSGLNKQIRPIFNTTVNQVSRTNGKFATTLSNNENVNSDAIIVSTGFDIFNAARKEEYGYGIYDNVITSSDLENLFRSGKKLETTLGKTPQRIGIIHCVGSRDEKVGNAYCSQVCCITAVKQSVEIKEQMPDCEVFCFYMDLRMFGRHYEEWYKKAQIEHGVQFIRGRLSEAFENTDGTIMLKAEDTLLNKPLKISVDMVILMVGMEPSASAASLFQKLNITKGSDGFAEQPGGHYRPNNTAVDGIFTAGTCNGPKTIDATLNEARSVAMEVANYLKN